MNAKLTLKTLASVVLFSIVFNSSNANAALITFTIRAAWQAAIAGPLFTEDFEPFPGGSNNNTAIAITVPPLSFTSAHNFTFSNSGPFTFSLFADANQNQLVLFRDFGGVGAGMQIAFPVSTSAFGFDYESHPAETYVLTIPSVVGIFPLTPGPAGFIGFIDTTAASFSSITLTGTSFGSGLFIDNISVVVPEPATFALFGAGLALLGAMRRRKDTNLA